MAPDVTTIDAAAAPQYEGLLAAAFQDDPLIRCIVPEPRRREAAKWMQSTVVRYCARYGRADATPDHGGVAAWLPPGDASVGPLRAARAGMWQTPVRLGLRATLRLATYARRKKRMRRRVTTARYWYLMLIAVDPGRQGEGIGGALMRAGLAAVDAEREPCYLETTNPGNLPFFERYGFETMQHVEGTPTQPPLWAMLRQPATRQE